jgi:hypothetical protein
MRSGNGKGKGKGGEMELQRNVPVAGAEPTSVRWTVGACMFGTGSMYSTVVVFGVLGRNYTCTRHMLFALSHAVSRTAETDNVAATKKQKSHPGDVRDATCLISPAQ